MQGIAIIGGLVSLITLIVFFILAARVGAIKTLLEMRAAPSEGPTIYGRHYEEGELAEFVGDKQHAIVCYKTALFYVNKVASPSDSDKRNKVQIEKKIAELSRLNSNNES